LRNSAEDHRHRAAGAAFDNLKQTVKEIEFLANPTVGEIRIGCPETVATLISPIVEHFTDRYPGIILDVVDVAAPTLDLPELRERSLDVALVRVAGLPSSHRFGEDLEVEVLLNDEAVVVVGKESPWARRRKLKLAEIADQPWILPPANSLNSAVIMDAFRSAGLGAPKVSLTTFSVQLRANLVARGRHITVFPKSLMRLSADRMALKALPIGLPARDWPVAMVTLKNRMLNPSVQLFMGVVRRAFQSLGDERPI
jgi:DNA-binding transcriptional LysR family regulator